MQNEQMKMDFRGGKREGAGRPTIGRTKPLKVVLPNDHWDIIDHLISKKVFAGYNDFLRSAVADKLRKDELMLQSTMIVDGNKCTVCKDKAGIYLFSEDKHLCDVCIQKV